MAVADHIQEPEFDLNQYIDIAKRRYVHFLFPSIAAAFLISLVVLLLPPIYRSTGVVLVESQQIPTELVQSTITSFADERIQVIKQRVLTRDNLVRIADQFGVFGDKRSAMSATQVVDQMRKMISLEIIDAGVRNKRKATTISFSLSFEHRNPEMAHRVANELVTLFLDENVRTRTERAAETTDFLTEEAKKLRTQLEEIEDRIAAYKQENNDALPEHLELRMKMLERAETDIKDTTREIASLGEDKRLMEVELTSLRHGQGQVGDKSSLSASQELARLQAELAIKSTTYAETHPDIQVLKSKIADLKKALDPASYRRELQKQLTAAKADLGAATAKYVPTHPDVVQLENKVSALEAEIKSVPSSPTASAGEAYQDPAIASVTSRIEAAEARIASLDQQKKETQARIEQLEEQVMRTPQVERGLNVLSRDYDNAKKKYEDVKAKQLEAQLAENLEEEKKAERFALLEPPQRPDIPSKPNRKKLLALGLLGSMGLGAGIVMLFEMADQSIRTTGQLEAIIGEPPLITIPYIKTRAERQRTQNNSIAFVAFCFVMVCVALALIHIFYAPLDVVLDRALDVLGL